MTQFIYRVEDGRSRIEDGELVRVLFAILDLRSSAFLASLPTALAKRPVGLD